jgi:hypothetical protein
MGKRSGKVVRLTAHAGSHDDLTTLDTRSILDKLQNHGLWGATECSGHGQ